MATSIPFEVESTLEAGGEAYVLARALAPVGTTLSGPTSTLGGCALTSWQFLPHSAGDWGQRAERVVFCLAVGSDRVCFVVGQRVTLDAPASAPGTTAS